MSTPEKSGTAAFAQTPSVDALRTGELATALRDTAASYKFFWLLALMDLLQALDRPVPIGRVVEAMIVRAWAPVALFRLSLGKADRLQDCVRSFQSDRGLPARSASQRLHAELERWPGLPMWADELARFVPGRFLGAWFPDVARARPYDRRGARDVATTAASAWGTDDTGPYRLINNCGDAEIELAPGWRDWLQRNRALVLGFTEQRLSLYLQARNPDVPGIVSKLKIPARRSLAQQRTWWRWAMSAFESEPVRDIYTGSELGNDFEVDHFLPWWRRVRSSP